MFNIFNKDKPSKEEPSKEEQAQGSTQEQSAPGTNIKYDPDLIDAFTNDHRNLLELFTAADEAYNQQDFISLQKNLVEFQDALTGHLLTENVRFYTYMKHLLESDAQNSELLKSLSN